MIKAEWLFWLVALYFAIVAVLRLRDRTDAKRFGSAAFWGILAFAFVYATFVVDKTGSALVEGIAVLALAALAGAGFPGKGADRTTSVEQREKSAAKYGNKLFVPALMIPAIAAVFALMGIFEVTVGGELLLEDKQATIIGLGIAAVVAMFSAMVIFNERRVSVPFEEGDRLLGHIGWAAILPQFLATLGVLFKDAGVGEAVKTISETVLPHGSLIAGVVVYCIGMFLFTVIMGNAFAAFPVMTAAVGWPVLIESFHGNPAAVFAIGMLAGFCGTLCTPMAANFNMVPAALLELKDQYGPIKAQIPTAIALLACNIVLMYLLCF